MILIIQTVWDLNLGEVRSLEIQNLRLNQSGLGLNRLEEVLDEVVRKDQDEPRPCTSNNPVGNPNDRIPRTTKRRVKEGG